MKSTDKSTVKEINNETKVITENLNLADKIEYYPENYAFITIKNHRANFPHLKC